tara:strand:- start:1697 stop:1840 length:144 start_codon:yes stop_codon:yes gene_type:complete
MKIGKMMTTALWIIVAELGVLLLLFIFPLGEEVSKIIELLEDIRTSS